MGFANGREGTKHREMQEQRVPKREHLRRGLVLGEGGGVKRGLLPTGMDRLVFDRCVGVHLGSAFKAQGPSVGQREP